MFWYIKILDSLTELLAHSFLIFFLQSKLSLYDLQLFL